MSTISAGTTTPTALSLSGDTTGALTFQVNGTTTAATITAAGNVGIGTSTPAAPLTIASVSGTAAASLIQGEVNNERFQIRSAVGSTGLAGGTAVVSTFGSRGTIASPSASLSGDQLGYYQLGGYDGTNWVRSAWITGLAAENYSATNRGSHLTFATTPIGSTAIAERMRIDSSGNVGIGTASPDAKLTVSGGAASFADGTSSAPAIANAGDLDTGVYFPAANEVAVTTGGTVAAGFNSNGLFFRNRIINGDMRIDQRNAGASVAVADNTLTFITDRWSVFENQTGAFSWQQVTDAPTGFVNSLKCTVTTAQTTDSFAQCKTIIEGTNTADLAWGSASALPITLSFWVKSSLTGQMGGALSNSAQNRSYPFSYTVNAANTWEYKTVTVLGDTTGTWLTTTGIGIQVFFDMGMGTTYLGTAGSWAAADYRGATGDVKIMRTLNATWQITGVQLETGSVATPFERRPYGTELMLCQRYCYSVKDDGDGNAVFGMGMAFGNTTAGAAIQLPVTMRATPSTLTTTGTFNVWSSGGAALAVTATSLNVVSSQNIAWVSSTVGGGGLVAGNATALYAASTTAQLTFSAEL